MTIFYKLQFIGNKFEIKGKYRKLPNMLNKKYIWVTKDELKRIKTDLITNLLDYKDNDSLMLDKSLMDTNI